MRKNNKITHVPVKDTKGTDYLCPVKTDNEKSGYSSVDLNECFEEDVPGRYAARIVVRQSR